MKFRRSKRHTKLNWYPSTCNSVSHQFALLLLDLQIIFSRFFVFFLIFPSRWSSSNRILTSLNHRAFTTEYPISSPRRTFNDLPRRTRYRHGATFPRELLARDSRSRECRARRPKEADFLRARERASVYGHLLRTARAGGARTFHWVNVVVPPFWLHFRYRPTTRSHYRHSGGGSERDGRGMNERQRGVIAGAGGMR